MQDSTVANGTPPARVAPANGHVIERAHGQYVWLCGVLPLYAAVFLIYSETWAFTWDESYHLPAAQLVGAPA